MTTTTGTGMTGTDLRAETTGELLDLADVLEAAPAGTWEAPSLCEGWRTREVVAHLTMPSRYGTEEFMAELAAAGGDFTRLSNTIAERDGALAPAALLDDLRAERLHAWEPPGGGQLGALTHAVIHGLDITEATGLGRTVPAPRMAAVLGAADPTLFGVELARVQLQADDLDWTFGSGELVTGPAQVLALVVCGRAVPAGRLAGPGAASVATRGW
jgi:uncharacterized protein (TIGR03083 family)